MAQLDASYQNRLAKGILSEAFRLNMDVLFFSPLIKESNDYMMYVGESTIFSIINYRKLDGIIIVPDTINFKEPLQKIIDYLVSPNNTIPTVSVDYPIEGLINISHNDALDIKKVIDYLIEEMGYTRINFMTGPKGHPHSDKRTEGYLTSLKEHGIEFEEERLTYGDFWYRKGADCVDAMLSSPLPLPQAIACACDTQAISVIDALEKKGFKVPEDMMVTGYDHNREDCVFKQAIVSKSRNTTPTGMIAIRALYNQLFEEQLPLTIDDYDDVFVTGQTLINNEKIMDIVPIEESTWHDTTTFFSVYNSMLETLIKQRTIKEFLSLLKWYSNYITDLRKLYVCLRDDINSESNYQNTQMEPFGDSMILAYQSDEKGTIVNLDHRFKTTEMLPMIEEPRDYPSSYIFTPFHNLDNTYGYLVLSYGNQPITYGYEYVWWVRFVNNAFESLRLHIIQQETINKNEQLTKQIINTQEEVILAFAEIAESKSEQTGCHIKRVSEYSRILGEGLGLTKDEVATLRIASMMHDVGKINIPSEILEKPGKLTAEEFEVIKSHVIIGERLLHNAPGDIMKVAKDIALGHHEKWNGTGYLGRKGDEIDLNSQIVAVADVFDALISKRSYKDAWSFDKAFQTIVDDRGEHFSPAVVDVFIEKYDDILHVAKMYKD